MWKSRTWRRGGRAARAASAHLLLAAAVMATPSPAIAAGASVEDATDDQRASAKEKYQAGMAAFEAQKYDEALELFQQSYDVVASPNSHLMIARSLSRLNRVTAAYAEYALVMAEAQASAQTSRKYRQTADAARNERAELKNRLGFVSPRIDATIAVAGKDVSTEDLGHAIPVDPGTVKVTVRTANGEATEEVQVAPGKNIEVLLTPPAAAGAAAAAAPCPASPPPAEKVVESRGIDQKTLALVSAGVGVAGFAAFGVFGILNNSKYDDLESRCTGGVCPASLSDEGEAGRRYQTFANIGLGVGAVGLSAGLILWLTAPGSSERETSARRIPDVAVTGRSVSVSGRF